MNTEIITDHVLLEQLNLTNDEICLRISGTIDSDCAERASDKIIELDKKGLPFIPILISSGGGNVDDLLTLMNVIDTCSTKIMTICLSCACSAAAVLFSLGSNGMRIMAPNSFLMFHESSMAIENAKQGDIVTLNSHYLKLDRMINKKIEKHCDLDPNFFDNHSHDYYLNPPEAKKFGICSHIGLPVIKIKLSFEMDFDIKTSKRHETSDAGKRDSCGARANSAVA